MISRLLARIRSGLIDLFDMRLAALIGLFAILLVGVAQFPLRYPIVVGQEDGIGADLPLISRFYGTSAGPNGPFRWSGARSVVRLAGFAQHPLLLTIHILPIPRDVYDRGQPAAGLWANGQQIAPLVLRPDGARYHILVPPLPINNPTIEFRSSTFRVAGDDRNLGIPVGTLLIQRSGLALPTEPSIIIWLLLPILLWAGLRWSGFSPSSTTWGCQITLVLVACAAMLDPPRSTLAAQPLLSALGMAVGLCIVLRIGMPQLFIRFGYPLSARALRWLLFFALVVFTLRYGGKIVPGAMPGDIGFHAHRYAELIEGQIFLQAPHRGVLSPYPPALYLILAPLALLGIDLPMLLHLSAALLDALSPFVVYMIAMAGFRQHSRNEIVALLAAGFYALAPGGMLASWWNFSTFMFAQAIHLSLIAALVLALQWHTDSGQSRASITLTALAILVLLEFLAYLSHFSYYLNDSLLVGGATALVLALAIARRISGNTARWVAITALGVQLATFSIFYSFFLGTIRNQVGAVGAAGEDTALQNMQSLSALIDSLLGEGLRDHTGLFPALLALVGMALGLATMRRSGSWAARQSKLTLGVLAGLTVLIATGFALLPLFSSANLTTRWLMFSLWVIGIWGARTALRYWQRGRAGQLIIILIGAYLIWISAAIWLQAMAWRIRPPEPF